MIFEISTKNWVVSDMFQSFSRVSVFLEKDGVVKSENQPPMEI
jgi:hypothetical protein